MSTVVKEVRREGGTTVVAAQGEIDLRHSPDFHKTLMKLCEEHPQILVIHLGEVTYMDSSGVGTLVAVFRRTKEYGGRMVLVAPTARVRGIFEITRLDRFFTIKDSEEAGLADDGSAGR